MVLHENFLNPIFDRCVTPLWFSARAKLYADIAEWSQRQPDMLFFELSDPNDGFIDVNIYCNGNFACAFDMGQCFDPTGDLRKWMEAIVKEEQLTNNFIMDNEGRYVVLSFDFIRFTENVAMRKDGYLNCDGDDFDSFDAINYPSIGIFSVYDSTKQAITFSCLCEAKQLVTTLYGALLNYAFQDCGCNLIGHEWYYADQDKNGEPLLDNWTFYNGIKSALIEANIDSHESLRFKLHKMQIKAKHTVHEAIHMWPDYGGSLFWQYDGCCGDMDGFLYRDDCQYEINLSDMPELRKWYDEFDISHYPGNSLDKSRWENWLRKGWELAKEIRRRMPTDVDLFYQWRTFTINKNGKKVNVDIPMIVPNELDVQYITKLS